MGYCIRCGLIWQGLTHDLSKYMPSEFLIGAKYFQGNRSPNDMERRANGLSTAWLHHKGCNRHHYEYWTDYIIEKGRGVTGPVPMPKRYIAEMFCDRVAACRTYQKEAYTKESPLTYYSGAKANMSIHPNTRADLELLLTMCSERGEKETFKFIKKEYLRK